MALAISCDTVQGAKCGHINNKNEAVEIFYLADDRGRQVSR
jgi:hypothetical protein